MPQRPDEAPVKLIELQRHAERLGLSAELDQTGEGGPGDWFLSLSLPNGRHHRTITVGEDRAEKFLDRPLDQVTFLGDYRAISDRSTGLIEAALGRDAGNGMTAFRVPLWQLPGAEILDDFEEVDGYSAGPRAWRLLLSDEHRSIEISPMSAAGELLLGRGGRNRQVSMKLSGFRVARHDEALSDLTKTARSVLFDLELLYNMQITLLRQPAGGSRIPMPKAKQAPTFPRNSYAAEAVELYNYGRAAVSLPLLQFLAYYQALEYFFPIFARTETTRAMRNAIRDPRFDGNDDADIGRLIALAAPAIRAGAGERQQLAATLRAAVEPSELIAEIQRIENALGDHFTGRKQILKGVAALRLNESDILTQVAERIYVLRCRIVHTKAEFDLDGVEMLLPNGPEGHGLRKETPLLRFIAQKAITSSSQPLHFT